MTSGSFLQNLIAVAAVTYVYYTWRTKIPLVWTQRAAQKIIVDLVHAEIQTRSGQKIKIYDLGAGLGGLCVALARAFPEVEIVGVEMAWPMWIFCVMRQKLCRQKNLRFLYGDFWGYDISDGDIVVCYLGDVVMRQMQDKLRRDARAGRLFISNTFPLPAEWAPIERIPVAASLSKEILVYRQEQ